MVCLFINRITYPEISRDGRALIHHRFMGLRVIEWVEFNMKSSASHMVSGKMPLVLVPENGRFFPWLFHANQNVSSTHTDFHFFALWKRYAAYLVIPRRGSLLLFGAQKNSLQRLRSNAFRLLRQEDEAGR